MNAITKQNQIKTSNHWLEKPNLYTADATRILSVAFAEYKKITELSIKNKNSLIINKPAPEVIQLFLTFRNDKNVLQRIRNANEELVSKPVGMVRDISDKDWKMIGPAITAAELKENILTIKLNADVVDYLTTNKNYTLSYIESIAELTTINQINFYNLLIRYANLKEIKLDIKTIRNRLGVADSKYKLTGSLIDKLIGPCAETINKLTNLSVSFNPIKTGKTITHIKFNIAFKDKLSALDHQSDQASNNQELTEKLSAIGLSPNAIKSLKKYNPIIVETTIDKVVKQQKNKRIHNIKSYFFVVLNQTLKNNQTKGYKGFLIGNYLNSLTVAESNNLWDLFITSNTNNKELNDLIKTRQTTSSEAVRATLSKEINTEYFRWIYNNKLQGE